METRDNKFLDEYWNICESAKNRNLPNETYTERHHIYPKSIYGKNAIIVILTAQEHFLVHKYLWLGLKEKYGKSDDKTRKMANAFRYFCTTKENKIILTPEEYELLRIAHAEANRGRKHTAEFRKYLSEINLGEKNAMYGKNKYDIWVEKYGIEEAEIRKRNMYKKSLFTRKQNNTLIRSEESKEKNRQSHIGKKSSEETKILLSKIISERSREEKQRISAKATETKRNNGTLNPSEESKEKNRLAKIGEKNPMYGTSPYAIWVEKYGVEEAELRKKRQQEKTKETKRIKKNLN